MQCSSWDHWGEEYHKDGLHIACVSSWSSHDKSVKLRKAGTLLVCVSAISFETWLWETITPRIENKFGENEPNILAKRSSEGIQIYKNAHKIYSEHAPGEGSWRHCRFTKRILESGSKTNIPSLASVSHFWHIWEPFLAPVGKVAFDATLQRYYNSQGFGVS